MSSLPTELRNKLEKAVTSGRNLSEKAARAALEALAVHHHEPFPHMTPAQRTLRNQLRARAQQVGDMKDTKGQLSLAHLVQECAYEHWHRMLFARFLAENNLLMLIEDGKTPVPVSLDDCKELAKEAKTDLWTLAGRYAEKMLPKIFRPDDPLLQVTLARENQLELERELDKLSTAVFTAGDSLGWCYQFWQADQKEIVNKSGKKIGADELPAVTQLFTEDYMVEFLLHNTLGAWWTAKRHAEGKKQPLTFSYLRLNEDGTPAAGAFVGWPKTVKELRLLDPCMGSGHFLVFALLILAQMRMEEEKLTAAESCMAVLRDNLFGLELDARCTQIGAFNLALAAWKLGGYQTLPPMNMACSGLGVNAREADWLAIAGDNDKLQRGMQRLYQLFRQAPVLGSLINPRALGGDLLVADFHELQPLLEQALQREKAEDAHEMAVTAQGLAKAAEILAGQFTLVATNVPYLGRLKQNELLREYCERVYPESKADLATCFIERCLSFLAPRGSTVLVTPQNWLFLGTFRKLRETLLKTKSWNTVVQLGEEAWWSFGMRGPRTVLLVLSEIKPQASHYFFGIDVSTNRAQKPILLEEKAARLSDNLPTTIKQISQQAQFDNPDATIVFEPASGITLLSEYADSVQGASTLDIERFRLLFWEVAAGDEWSLHQSTPAPNGIYSGLEFVSIHRRPGGQFDKLADDLKSEGRLGGAWSGQPVWGKKGVACSWMGTLPTAIYVGAVYDNSIAAIVPKNPNHLPAIWCYCSSPLFLQEVRKINHKPQVANATLVKVPFDVAHWQKVATEKYPHGLPRPFSSDSTQWLFNGHPNGSGQPLQVAVARLLGYRWPRQTGSSFPDCPALGADNLEELADDDGIVCLPSVRGEEPAAERLRKLLREACGADWKSNSELALIHGTGSNTGDLDEWLREDFFGQHCALFQQRPFVWHIWDGRKRDGFHALLNYHTLASGDKGRRTLENLTHSYLGEWITRQKDSQKRGEEGADERLAAALALKEKLEAILAGEPPFDVFVRWKPLAQQAIGWQPDIHDGVRMNIRPFATADILRKRVKIKWEKDRGNEPKREKSDFPWFWKDGVFTGERLNDVHLKNEEKQRARTA